MSSPIDNKNNDDSETSGSSSSDEEAGPASDTCQEDCCHTNECDGNDCVSKNKCEFAPVIGFYEWGPNCGCKIGSCIESKYEMGSVICGMTGYRCLDHLCLCQKAMYDPSIDTKREVCYGCCVEVECGECGDCDCLDARHRKLKKCFDRYESSSYVFSH